MLLTAEDPFKHGGVPVVLDLDDFAIAVGERIGLESGFSARADLRLGVGGLRWGEAIALRVCDVDFLRRRIALHRNVVRVRGQFVVGSLKSNKNRTVVVPAFVMTALARDRRGQGP